MAAEVDESTIDRKTLSRKIEQEARALFRIDPVTRQLTLESLLQISEAISSLAHFGDQSSQNLEKVSCIRRLLGDVVMAGGLPKVELVDVPISENNLYDFIFGGVLHEKRGKLTIINKS